MQRVERPAEQHARCVVGASVGGGRRLPVTAPGGALLGPPAGGRLALRVPAADLAGDERAAVEDAGRMVPAAGEEHAHPAFGEHVPEQVSAQRRERDLDLRGRLVGGGERRSVGTDRPVPLDEAVEPGLQALGCHAHPRAAACCGTGAARRLSRSGADVATGECHGPDGAGDHGEE